MAVFHWDDNRHRQLIHVALFACFVLSLPRNHGCAQTTINLPPPIDGPEPIRAHPGLVESDVESLTQGDPLPTTLTVADVVASVYQAYPEIRRARQEAARAQGELVGAYGAYDTKLIGLTISEPTGFYKNYRHGIGVARQTWWGGNVAGGYRIGRGVFQPWYLERETEKAGEFKVGLTQPLLQGRAIDPQRVAVFQASLARRAADPIVQAALLNVTRDAATEFWRWVAAGATLQAQQKLLELAESRGQQFEAGFKAGKFAEIDLILNGQLIAERRAKTIESERKYRQSALKLSLYLRDDAGEPLVAQDDWLPTSFPRIDQLPQTDLDQETSLALSRRPEVRQLELELRKLNLDRQLACNQTLPQLDLIVEGSQDIGQPGSSGDDKGKFVLVVGATTEVPIQRRKARGKIQESNAKIAQTSQKLRLQRDKIATDLRTAHANLVFSQQIVEQARIAFEAALDTLQRYRFAFDQGKIDLIYLNLLETKANETEIKLIEAQQAWFVELSRYQAAAGLDPLQQATLVSELPMD